MIGESGKKYTFGYVPDVNGFATDAYVRGTWDEVEDDFLFGRIDFDEYRDKFLNRRG